MQRELVLTQDDIEHIEETATTLQDCDPCDDSECNWPDCDCNSSEIIMTSIGYVEVFPCNGEGKAEAIGYGRVLWTQE